MILKCVVIVSFFIKRKVNNPGDAFRNVPLASKLLIKSSSTGRKKTQTCTTNCDIHAEDRCQVYLAAALKNTV